MRRERRSAAPKVTGKREEQILELYQTGLVMNKIAKQVGVGSGTVQRIIAAYKCATTQPGDAN